MATIQAAAEDYFSNLNPIASKIYSDIVETKIAYKSLWESLNDRERNEVINESIIKPEVVLKYALLDNFDYDLNDTAKFRKDDLMSFFGKDHGQRTIQDDNSSYRDEHSAPFIYQTKSQLNLCELSEARCSEDITKPTSPGLSNLALSHSKVVSELKNALKSHDMLRNVSEYAEKPQELTYLKKCEEVNSPTGFISKLMGNKKFKTRDADEKECLVSPETPAHIVASSDNYFRTNFKGLNNALSPTSQQKSAEKNQASYTNRNSIVKSTHEESRGLLVSSSLDSSGTEFLSCEDIASKTESTETLTSNILPKTGYDFLDNW